MNMRNILAIVSCAVMFGTLSFPSFAHEDTAQTAEDLSRKHLIEVVGPAVYAIDITLYTSNTNDPLNVPSVRAGGGTGFAISEEGLVMTAAHVVRPFNPNLPAPKFIAPNRWEYADGTVIEMSFRLTSIKGREHTARIVAVHPNPEIDLAVLVIDNLPLGEKLPFAVFETKPLYYDRVVAIGGPFGITFSVSEGIISNPHARSGNAEVVQFDAPINPGNSGGPLVLFRNHKVAGVVIELFNPFSAPFNIGIGFAVPASIAKPFADEVVKQYREERSHAERGARSSIL